MEEVKGIVKKLIRNKFIEKTVRCMEVCGHRWMMGEDDFRIPTKKEVRETIEYLVELVLKDPCYKMQKQPVKAHGGGIEVSCERDCVGCAWTITYTGHSQNSFIEKQ